jgi:ferredoxin
MLVDLSLLVKPVLTIVDAVDSMEGNGPSGGTIRHTGMLFASRNLYALDLALCAYVGFSPDEVLTVRHAVDTNLCPATAAELDWLGEKPDFLPDFTPPDSRPTNFTSHVPVFLRKPTAWLLEHVFESRPVILRDRCIGCGKCAESCAPGAAVVQERKAVIDKKLCIKCYCCHEFCPVKAVKIKRPFFVGK